MTKPVQIGFSLLPDEFNGTSTLKFSQIGNYSTDKLSTYSFDGFARLSVGLICEAKCDYITFESLRRTCKLGPGDVIQILLESNDILTFKFVNEPRKLEPEERLTVVENRVKIGRSELEKLKTHLFQKWCIKCKDGVQILGGNDIHQSIGGTQMHLMVMAQAFDEFATKNCSGRKNNLRTE